MQHDYENIIVQKSSNKEEFLEALKTVTKKIEQFYLFVSATKYCFYCNDDSGV